MNTQLLEANTRPDLRSPVSAKIRRGTTVGWLRIFTLILLDSALLSLAWQIAAVLVNPTTSSWDIFHHPASLLPMVGIIVGVLIARGLYQPGTMRRNYLALAQSITLAEGLLLLVAFFYNPNQFVSRSHFLLSWGLNILLLCAGRFTVDWATNSLRRKGAVRYPAFLISDSDHSPQAIDIINQEKRYNILGIASASALDRDNREETFAKLHRLGVAEAFVSWDAIRRRLFLCWHFQTAGITLHILPIGLDPLPKGSEFWVIGGAPSLTFPAPIISGVDFGLKRIFDIACALILLVVLSPVLLLIALLIKLDSAGPVFYRQTRIGLHGKPFKAWKFRTMVVNADKLQKELEAQNEMKDGIMFKMKDDPRITRIGKFLRCYSLDELPQLFNVVLGEMSLVGPRPFPIRDVEKFSERHFIRHEVLPGITGLWQVSGRSEITDFEQVIYWDLTYIEKWSIWLDVQILFRTVQVVLNKTGAY